MERPTEANCPARKNTALVLNTRELSGAHEKEVITISSVASPEPQIVTIGSYSNEPTIPYGYGRQEPIIVLSLDDLNFPANPFNVLATLAVIQPDEENRPQSLELSHSSPISMPPRNLSNIEGWEAQEPTTYDNTFYSEDGLRRVYLDIPCTSTFDSNEHRQIFFNSRPSSTPSPPRRQKRKLRMGISFPEKGSVAVHVRGMQPAPASKNDNLMLKEELKH